MGSFNPLPFPVARAVVLVEMIGPEGPVRMAINMQASELTFSDEGDFDYHPYSTQWYSDPHVEIKGRYINMTMWKGEFPEEQTALESPHAMIDASNDEGTHSPAPQS